jgi:mannitol-specific phosphotransferase system IIBC component
MIPINFISVIVAAVVAFIVGFMFHGPLFGKMWMKLANIHPTGKEKLSDMFPQMVKNLVANIVCAYVLAMFIYVTASYYNNVGNIVGGMGISFWAWLGFLVTSTSMDVIWMGKSKNLWLFEAAASLVSFLAMGAVLAAW